MADPLAGGSSQSVSTSFCSAVASEIGSVPTSSQSCTVNWGTCAPPTPPTPPTPPPGSTERITQADLICGSSHPEYNTGYGGQLAPTSVRNTIIDSYKNIRNNNLKRCPEPSGFSYWQGHYFRHGLQDMINNIIYTPTPVSEALRVANGACESAAKRQYGAGKFKTATYVIGSGNKCEVKF
jgi:hypothetical protein